MHTEESKADLIASAADNPAFSYSTFLDQVLDKCPDNLHVGCGLKACHDVSLAVHDELCEVLLDLGIVLVILVDPLQEHVHGKCLGTLSESLEALLALEVLEELNGVLAVDV